MPMPADAEEAKDSQWQVSGGAMARSKVAIFRNSSSIFFHSTLINNNNLLSSIIWAAKKLTSNVIYSNYSNFCGFCPVLNHVLAFF